MSEDQNNLTVPAEILYQVIGENKIGEYAIFFNSNQDSLLRAQEEVIKQFCMDNVFSKEEFEHFKMGAATISLIFARCLEIVEATKKQQEKEQKKET